jgi:ketosteroid isomerase-like protein
MSREIVELVKQLYGRWEQGDLRAGREILDESLTTVWAPGFPTAGIYRGPHEHTRAMREWLGEWDDFGRVVRFEVHLDVDRALQAASVADSFGGS